MKSSLKFSMALLTLLNINSCTYDITKENSEEIIIPENSSWYRYIKNVAKSSEIIVLGKVINKKDLLKLPCYLTEYEISIEDVFKGRKKNSILPGNKITVFGAGGKLDDGGSAIFVGEPSFENGSKYFFFLNHEIPKRYLQKTPECMFQYGENVYIAYDIAPKAKDGNITLDSPIPINQSINSFKDLIYKINQQK